MTEEQMKHLMQCLKYGPQAVQGLLEMERFQSSMEKLQAQAGYAQSQLADVSQAIFRMASKDVTLDE